MKFSDLREDIIDIHLVKKIHWLYRGDDFIAFFDLKYTSDLIDRVSFGMEELSQPIELTLEPSDSGSKWKLLIPEYISQILTVKQHDFTLTVKLNSGEIITLFKGIMNVNNRVFAKYFNGDVGFVLVKSEDPTQSDNQYAVGTKWINTEEKTIFELTQVKSGIAHWTETTNQTLQPIIDQLAARVLVNEGNISQLQSDLGDLESDKLDKIWNDITSQSLTNLNDEFVLNRGGAVYKTTLANMLSHVVPIDIFVVVSALPEVGLPNKIYLVSSEDPELQNTLDEFIWIENDWEMIGNIKVDLDAHNVRFNGSGTNYLVNKNDVESAVKELDTQVKDAKEYTYSQVDIDNKDTAASNILNANPNIVFENEVIYNRRVRGWKEIGEVPIYLRKDEIGTNRIAGSALVGDEIYWIGGTILTTTASSGLTGASNKNISYNLKTNVWKENLNLPYWKDAPTLVAVGTDIYVLGSMGRKNKFYPFDNVFVPDYKYDTLTDTYEEISSLQDNDYLYVSIQSSGADHLDGKIYISGRYWFRKEKTTGDTDILTEPRIAIYDIENDTWSLGATPPMSNDGGSSQILDRKFYVYRNTLYAYDIDNDTWSSPLNVSGIESRSHTSMAKRDGKLYVIGGYISGSSPVRTSGKTYVYDPILNEWEEDVDLVLNNDYGIGIGYSMAVVWNDSLVVFGGTGFDENKYNSGSKIEDQFRNFNVYIEDYRLEKDLTPIYEKTAKLAVSNVFTQPQQVPNATLPQHTTNLNQVETMFEMFKQQLRGYNLASPDLTGKEYLGDGVYRLQSSYDDNLFLDYNVLSGVFHMHGVGNGDNRILYSFADKDFVSSISYSIILVERTNQPVNISFGGGTAVTNDRVILRNTDTYVVNNDAAYSEFTKLYTVDFVGDIDVKFKLQLEKGTTATPYTVPGQIPQYKIVGEE